MKTWFEGKPMEMYVGQVVTVYRCGEDHKEYGEFATLTRATKRYLIFTTDSGATVKTRRECLHATVGDAKEKGYQVSTEQQHPIWMACSKPSTTSKYLGHLSDISA